MSERTNAERAERAEAALMAYIEATGDSLRANEISTWIGDLMCDMRHFCAFMGETFPEGGGEMNFEAECLEDPTGCFLKSEDWLTSEKSEADTKKPCAHLEAAARYDGWEFGGDAPGFWFHKKTWGTWKAAASWAGTDQEPNGPNDRPAIYDTIKDLVAHDQLPSCVTNAQHRDTGRGVCADCGVAL